MLLYFCAHLDIISYFIQKKNLIRKSLRCRSRFSRAIWLICSSLWSFQAFRHSPRVCIIPITGAFDRGLSKAITHPISRKISCLFLFSLARFTFIYVNRPCYDKQSRADGFLIKALPLEQLLVQLFWSALCFAWHLPEATVAQCVRLAQRRSPALTWPGAVQIL